jgi:hypothetical protein
MLGRGVSARRPLHLRVRTFGERCL